MTAQQLLIGAILVVGVIGYRWWRKRRAKKIAEAREAFNLNKPFTSETRIISDALYEHNMWFVRKGDLFFYYATTPISQMSQLVVVEYLGRDRSGGVRVRVAEIKHQVNCYPSELMTLGEIRVMQSHLLHFHD